LQKKQNFNKNINNKYNKNKLLISML
jgi:hypothetical protein